MTTDREELQALLTADGDVHLDAGRTYVLDQAGLAYWTLDVPAGCRVHGHGATLQLAAGAASSVRLLHLTGSDILLEDLTLDGNKAAQGVDEQRHGIFAQGTAGLRIRDVTARNFTGDGIALYQAHDTLVTGVDCVDNARNGLTLNGSVSALAVACSTFARNGAQQVDSEPAGADVVGEISLVHCTLDVGGGNDFALAISGTSSTPGGSWYVCDCRIVGGVNVVWARDVVIAGCSISNPTTKPCVNVYRSSARVSLVRNALAQLQTGLANIPAVMVQGTGTGSAPSDIEIRGNAIAVANPHGFGVRAEGCIDVSIVGNTLDGANLAAAGGAGIYLRATNAAEEFRRAVLRGNTIRGFGERGIDVRGNGAARLLAAELRDNAFDNLATPAAMTKGIVLDDGTSALRRADLGGNQYLTGIATPLSGVRADLALTMGAD